MNSVLYYLTYGSALGSGLIAGIFFAFSTFVMKALAKLPAAQGIAAMQSINTTILQTLFSLVFMGTALICVVLGVAAFFNWGSPGASYVLIGSLLYLLGSFIVTVIFNVPLNDALAAVKPGSPEGARVWAGYLTDWVVWNHVRTFASLAALASFIIAIRKW
ncbi:anthrone oxygenase family protein [Paenibacillus radicis (ex Gao et al. 2016)]|uniref:Membrane protein n=1 Tax=Paenibacillus radicis (ex Gao et al. 2016) TaxID=1737354 RepID=A0A917H9X3_9BACL|nr:anthrone oxygenase family protein [Paenibacillus radicis (ex Gao et al. 2016)]GGG72761.1 membrane protein [Paenibacillus radicis (ex Gao et al. 2016)]